MTDAPERISFARKYMDQAITSGPLMDHPDYVEYIRADLVDAIIAAAQAVIDRWDSPDWKDEKHTADYINVLRRDLNTPEARAAILADAMKGQK